MSNYSIVINDRRTGFHTTIVSRTVAADALQDTIIEELNNINAEYPLTYADEIAALIDSHGEMTYRIDTINERKEIDSHFIRVARIS